MLGDILIQTLDGKIYFSEGGKAFEQLEFEKPESAVALHEVLNNTEGQAVGVKTVVHGRFANERMLNGGALWFIADVKKTISGEDEVSAAVPNGAVA